MHSIYARVNGMSSLWSTCIMVLLGAVALSSFVFTASGTGKVELASVKVYNAKGKRYPFRQEEVGFVRFNVTADLRPLFHWNTKQVFVYLEAEYTNGQTNSSVVLWDRIVRRREDAKIELSSRNKYKFRELSRSFRDVSPVAFVLKYNVMPHVGLLSYGEAARTARTDMPEALDSVS